MRETFSAAGELIRWSAERSSTESLDGRDCRLKLLEFRLGVHGVQRRRLLAFRPGPLPQLSRRVHDVAERHQSPPRLIVQVRELGTDDPACAFDRSTRSHCRAGTG